MGRRGGFHPDRSGRGPDRLPTSLDRLAETLTGKGPVWAYGITTYNPEPAQRSAGVPFRGDTLLPRTVESLKGAGFPTPTIFVDGDSDYKSWAARFNLPVVCRYPKVGAFGNWILALAELMVRNPFADYYAIFQDDIIISRNVRQYIEHGYPSDGYLNLYTFPRNQVLTDRVGWFKSDQSGLGALGLVFRRYAAVSLLTEQGPVDKPRTIDPQRRHKFVDGGVVNAMRHAGLWEYCHSPSLVQHTGTRSTLANPRHPIATSFRGEGFDALTLLETGDGRRGV